MEEDSLRLNAVVRWLTDIGGDLRFIPLVEVRSRKRAK
jgi:hypothetical protein